MTAYNRGRIQLDYCPRVFCVEPTNVCNFSCTSCPTRLAPARHLRPEVLDGWVSREPEPFLLGPIWLHFSGESLINPAFFDLAAVLRGHGVQIMLSTNASLLTEAR